MRPELEDTLKHYGVKGMKWDESKKKVEKNFDELLDAAREKASKVGKKLSKIDDVLKKFGSKKLSGISAIIKDIKEKNREPKSVSDIRGKIVGKKKKPKKETPAELRKRLKDQWKDVPDSKITDNWNGRFLPRPKR